MDVLRLRKPNKETLFNLLEGNVAAIIFEEIVNKSFTENVISNIDNFSKGLYRGFNEENATAFPLMFGQLLDKNNDADKDLYFQQIELFKEEWKDKIDKDFNIESILCNYFMPFKCEVLENFLPFSLRILHSQKGGLSAHKDEDLFEYIHEDVVKEIKKKIIPETMMSWFITIQNTEEGGNLNVLPNEFNQYKKTSEDNFLAPNNQEIKFKDLPFNEVIIPENSLFLFNGGDFWHYVSPIIGQKDRITLGGFWALSKDKNKVLFWS